MSSEVSKGVLRIFCLSVLWMGLGIVQLPMFYPLVALEKGVEGYYIGTVLALRPLTGICATPFINKYILSVSVELTIFIAGITYSLCFIAFAFVAMIDNVTTFILLSFFTQLFVGIAQAALIVGEQCLLLRYSEKGEREKNLGMFRVASGLGGLLSPMMGAGMYALGGFIATFSSVGIGYLCISPFIYWRLTEAREAWLLE